MQPLGRSRVAASKNRQQAPQFAACQQPPCTFLRVNTPGFTPLTPPLSAGSINIANGKTNPACTTFGPLDAAWRCAPFCTWAAGQGQLTANLGERHAALRCVALCCDLL